MPERPEQVREYALLLGCSITRASGDLNASQHLAAESLALDRTPYSLLESGLTAMHEGNFEESIRLFDEAIDLNLSFAPAWASKGEAHRQNHQWRQAVSALKMAVAAGDAPDFVHAELADACREMGDLGEAISNARIACRLNPSDWWNQAIRAQVLTARGESPAATQAFAVALSLASDPYSEGCVRILMQEDDLALDCLERTLTQNLRTVGWVSHDPDWRHVRDQDRLRRLLDTFSGSEP